MKKGEVPVPPTRRTTHAARRGHDEAERQLRTTKRPDQGDHDGTHTRTPREQAATAARSAPSPDRLPRRRGLWRWSSRQLARAHHHRAGHHRHRGHRGRHRRALLACRRQRRRRHDHRDRARSHGHERRRCSGRLQARADARGVQGRQVRGLQARRRHPPGRARRRGQEVHRRRHAARHPGGARPRADRGMDLRDQRRDPSRHGRLVADRRHRGRQGPDHLRQRRLEGDEGDDAPLDRLPLGRGGAQQVLRRRRGRQEADVQLRRQAPGRLHVPLRDAAGALAHLQRHGGHDGRQAAQPAQGRPRAVDHPVRVLPRQARRAGGHGQDGRRDPGRDRVQRLREPVQGQPDPRPQGREDPACTSSTRARASGAPST